MFRIRIALSTLAVLTLVSGGAHAQEASDAAAGPAATPTEQPSGAQAQDAQMEELRRRLDVLAAELEQLRSGETQEIEVSEARRQALGLAPSAVDSVEKHMPELQKTIEDRLKSQ